MSPDRDTDDDRAGEATTASRASAPTDDAAEDTTGAGPGATVDAAAETDDAETPGTDRQTAEERTADDAGTTASPADTAEDAVETPADEQTGEDDEARADAAAETGSGEPRAGTVRLSTLFEVLGNERRRHVIQVLREEETVGLADLAEAVAAREYGVAPEDLSRRQQKATYSALQQTHLPKMDDAGVLTFEKSAGEVTASDAIVEYTMYLDVVPSSGVRRSELYLYVAGAGAVVAAGLWAGLPPFVWLPPLAWGGLLLVSVAAVAVVQLYHHPLFPERLPLG